MRAGALATAFALAVLSGHVFDRTTGQGLAHVRVSVGSAHAVTDAAGRYVLRGVKPGAATVTLESDDVPLERESIVLGAGATRHDFHACSTTLDYNCGAPILPSSGGANS
jgi:hypothetical protein